MTGVRALELRPIVHDTGQAGEGPLGNLGLCVGRKGEAQVDSQMVTDAQRLHALDLAAAVAEPMHRAACDQVPGKSRSVVGVEPIEDPVSLADTLDQPHRGRGIFRSGELVIQDEVGGDVHQGEHDRADRAAVSEVNPEVERAAVERNPFQRADAFLVAHDRLRQALQGFGAADPGM